MNPTPARRALVIAVLLAAVVLIALALGSVSGFMVSRFLAARGQPVIANTGALLRQVQPLSQLVTVKYVIEKVVILEDVKWYGESRVLLVAHGVVKAGVDLAKLKPEDLRLDGRTLTVRMPQAQITDVYLDDNRTQVIERTTGLLRLFDKDLEQNARRQAVDDIRRAARASGIVADANERARAQLILLFRRLGCEEVRFE
jgi:hypothetical protein